VSRVCLPFGTEVFGRLLGYAPIVGAGDLHHLEPETSSKAVKVRSDKPGQRGSAR
jgi:hypothetical protein